MSIFYPKSADFIKNRAKQLQKIYPELPLSLCQKATSCALGFKDWFDATKRIPASNATQSASDEHVSDTVKIQRRYQQSKALIDITNLPPNEIDSFVRHWNLTSNMAPDLKEYSTPFDDVSSDLNDFENGKISAEELAEMYDFGEPPTRIKDGIILALNGHKYDYYHLSNQRLIDMPGYLRGNVSIFLEFEDGHYVKLAFPDDFSKAEVKKALDYIESSNPRIYEWYTGKLAKDFYGVSIADMVADAEINPDEWFALSYREDYSDFKNPKFYIPAIKGSDFIKFIDRKGSLLGIEVKWFKCNEGYMHRDVGLGFYGDDKTVRIDLSNLVEVDPIFSYPFKHGPMSDIEYSRSIEGGGWKLTDELEQDDIDDDKLDMSNVEVSEMMKQLEETSRLASENAAKKLI